MAKCSPWPVLLISQHERRVEHYVRREDEAWVLHEHAGSGAMTLATGGVLDIAALYRDAGV